MTVDVDTTQGIYDITENYEIEYSFSEKAEDWFRENWYWFAGAAVLALLFFMVRAIRNSKKSEEETNVPKIPAHVTALNALHALMNMEAWKEENPKDFYSTLTDTVRLYLEERYGIYAMEQTTREIIQNLKQSKISDDDRAFLKLVLSRADMVKFAKYKPQAEDGLDALNKSISFVERTKVLEAEEGDDEQKINNHVS